MSLAKKIAHRYITALSLYEDLGERGDCGSSRVVDRARQRRVYTPEIGRLYEQSQRSGGKPPYELESQTYPVQRGHDFVISLSHGMTLQDGSPWGGSEEIKLYVTLGSHAQLRMDERCVTLPQVKQVFIGFVKSLITAWQKKDIKGYSEYLKMLTEGENNKSITKGSVNVAFGQRVFGARHPTTSSNGVLVPIGTEFDLKVITVYQRTLNPQEQEDTQCISFLEDLGYVVTQKNRWARNASQKYASEETLSKTYKLAKLIDPSIVGLGLDTMTINIKYDPSGLPESISEFPEALLAALEDKIVNNMKAAFRGSSGSDSARLMHPLYYGGAFSMSRTLIRFKTKHPKLKTKLNRFHFLEYDAKEGSEIIFNLELPAPAPAARVPAPAPAPAPVVPRLSPLERKVQNCISAISDRYDVVAPVSQR